MNSTVKTFDKICRDASTAFLQTVVVIDNEASLRADEQPKPTGKKAAARRRPASPGSTAPPLVEVSTETLDSDPPGCGPDEDPNAHTLLLNEVSRAFADQKLTCGVYLPSDSDPQDTETLISETVAAIHPTDACILDWQLRDGDPDPAIKAIRDVLQLDEREGGRLRLILIYTAEDLKSASEQLMKALGETDRAVGLATSGSAPVITGGHFRIAFANKPTRGRSPEEDDAVVDWNRLPEKIVAEFTTLSRGLLRAFALQSVAAVRRDIHRILAQFDEELDPVYAGDRATKPDQADAASLIVDILNSELAHTVLHSDSALECLYEVGVVAWLDQCEERGKFRDVDGQLHHELPYKRIDRATRTALLSDRSPAASWLGKSGAKRFTKTLFPTDEAELSASLKLAALSTLVRSKDSGPFNAGEIRLGFGTIVQLEPESVAGEDASSESKDEASNEPIDSEVYVCIQPACESARISEGGRPFLLVKLVADEQSFELVTPKADGFHRWRMPKKDERLFKTVLFEASNGSDRVSGQVCPETMRSYFVDANGRSWTWIADLRDLSAINIRDSALRPLAGVGLNGLEWLRLRA